MGLKNRNITGILGFDVAKVTASPNASKPVYSFVAVGSDANIDIAIVPKGNGAISVRVPDGTAAGGNKRGDGAVDLQASRGNASQVASGSYSGILSGTYNKVTAANAVVAGGNINTASGVNSFVGSGDGNTASGQYSIIVGGQSNTASGLRSAIAGGNSNVAGGQYAFVGGGSSNSSSFDYAFVGGGYMCSSDGAYSVNLGGYRQTAYLKGQCCTGGYSAVAYKVRQDSKLTLEISTTAATATEMFLDNSSTRAVLKNNCAWAFDITILAHSSTNVLHTARFKRSGLILRGATAATTTLEGAVQTIGTDIVNSNLTGCAVAISADTTNGSLKVEVTGIASTTIIWQAKIELVEIEI